MRPFDLNYVRSTRNDLAKFVPESYSLFRLGQIAQLEISRPRPCKDKGRRSKDIDLVRLRMVYRQAVQAGRIGQRRLEPAQVKLCHLGGKLNRLRLVIGLALLVPDPAQGQMKAGKCTAALSPGCLRSPERPQRGCIIPLRPALVLKGLLPDLPALVPFVVDLV